MHMYVAAAQLATQHGSTVPWIWPQWSFDTNPGFGFVAGWVMAIPGSWLGWWHMALGRFGWCQAPKTWAKQGGSTCSFATCLCITAG